jgi:hypothetical protein
MPMMRRMVGFPGLLVALLVGPAAAQDAGSAGAGGKLALALRAGFAAQR